jgi:ribosome-binding factor A
MEPHRAERVSETIREELSEIIGYEMEDPRLGEVDVTEVIIGANMRHARVRVHLAGDEKMCADALLALDGARRRLRRELAARLRLFRMPELHFEADMEAGPAVRMGKLLREIREGRSESVLAGEKSALE